MFIPVGLIARLVVSGMESNRDAQVSAAMQRAAMEHDRANQEGAAHELWSACTGPSGCLLILGSNDWSNCAIDGIPITVPRTEAAATTTYRDSVDVLGPAPHGLLAMCPGRHVIVVRAGGRTVTTAITLHPREAYFLQLDPEAGTFARYEPSEEEAIMRRVSTGDVTLLDYSQFVAIPRLNQLLAKPSWDVIPACVNEINSLITSILSNQTSQAIHQAQRAGAMLTGVPLASFEPFTTRIGFVVFELVAKSQLKEAWTLLQAGLAVLPNNPTLLAVQGELQLKAGAEAEGIANLRLALARADGLDVALRDRVKALLDQAGRAL